MAGPSPGSGGAGSWTGRGSATPEPSPLSIPRAFGASAPGVLGPAAGRPSVSQGTPLPRRSLTRGGGSGPASGQAARGRSAPSRGRAEGRVAAGRSGRRGDTEPAPSRPWKAPPHIYGNEVGWLVDSRMADRPELPSVRREAEQLRADAEAACATGRGPVVASRSRITRGGPGAWPGTRSPRREPGRERAGDAARSAIAAAASRALGTSVCARSAKRYAAPAHDPSTSCTQPNTVTGIHRLDYRSSGAFHARNR